MRYLAILFALLEAAAIAGEAAISDEFVLNAPFDRVTAWIEANAAAVRESVNVQLVEQHGDTLTLKRENNRGTWVWKQRETVDKTKSRWLYTTTLIESVEGGISRLDGTVTIEEAGGKTKIIAKTAAVVDDVNSRDVRFDLHARARRIKKVMQENLE